MPFWKLREAHADRRNADLGLRASPAAPIAGDTLRVNPHRHRKIEGQPSDDRDGSVVSRDRD
jgi:hypothetical protein